MKELVEAAIRAAGQAGQQVAVFVTGNGGIPVGGDEVEQPGNRVGVEEAAAVVDSNAFKRDLEMYRRNNEKLREEIARMRKDMEDGGGEQPSEIHDWMSQPIDTLDDLNDDSLDLARRKGWKTVGVAYETVMSGQVKFKNRLSQINFLTALLKGCSGPSAPARMGDSTVPEGHMDRTWIERLKITRDREQKSAGVSATIADLEERLKAGENKVTDDKGGGKEEFIEDAIERQDRIRKIYDFQVRIGLYCLNLPTDSPDVSAALGSAGLDPALGLNLEDEEEDEEDDA